MRLKTLGAGVAAAVVIASATVTGASEAEAQDWIVLGNSDETFMGIDRASITIQGRNATVWSFLADYNTENTDISWDYTISRTTYECGTYKSRLLLLVGYDKRGREIERVAPQPVSEDYVVPGTLDASVYERACDGPRPNEPIEGSDDVRRLVYAERASSIADFVAQAEAAADAAAAAGDAAEALEAIVSDRDITTVNVPPCRNGAPECNPWERAWPDDANIPVGAVVTRDGRIVMEPRATH